MFSDRWAADNESTLPLIKYTGTRRFSPISEDRSVAHGVYTVLLVKFVC